MSFRISTLSSPQIITNYYNEPSVYGSFSSDVSQSLSLGISSELIHQVTDISSSGVLIDATRKKIYVQSSGVYKVLSSIQCDSSGGTHGIYMWPAVNGIAVPNSNTLVKVTAAIETVLTVEWFLPLNVNDYITIYATSDSNNGRIKAVSSIPYAGVPSIPGIITTVLKIS
jgi:hypothetical protein